VRSRTKDEQTELIVASTKRLQPPPLEATVFEDLRETSNIANFEKDGKGYVGNLESKDYLEKLLRK